MVDVANKILKRKRDKLADELAAHFQVSEPCWEKRKRRAKHFSLERQRLRDLLIILRHHYPDGIPRNINIDELVQEKAQILGDSLGLTAKERTMWGINTIRPCDQTAQNTVTSHQEAL